MTNIETKFMELGSAYFRENSHKEIDWEQRRYELVKGFLCECKDYTLHNQSDVIIRNAAKRAIKAADIIIEELKK